MLSHVALGEIFDAKGLVWVNAVVGAAFAATSFLALACARFFFATQGHMKRHTQHMATTIKVGEELRDRLNEDARKEGLTPAALIERLLDESDRRQRMAAFGRAFRAAGDEYWREFDAWNVALGDGIARSE